jgi:phenylacetate-CoA ligase
MALRSLYYLGKMWKNPRISSEHIERLQLKNLKAVVTHAYRNSPFYHDKYKKANVHPQDINSLKDISKLPFTTKEEIRDAGKRILAQNIPPREYRFETTSGSTGKKLELIHSRRFIAFKTSIFYRIYLLWGMRPFKRITYIRYKPLQPDIAKRSRIIQLNYISTFMEADEQFNLLLKQKPRILVGHPPDLVDMATLACARGDSLKFDFIGSNSEILTQREREFLEETFRCPVYEEYSSIELGFMAHNCKKKNMHVISDSVILEIAKNGEIAAPGEKGEVIATSLFKSSMPFIRYRHRDVATLSDEKCDCGITFPLMYGLEGRKDDLLLLPSGKEVSPTRIVPLFFDIKTIKEFNVVQTSINKAIVNLVPYEGFDEKDEANLLNLLKTELQGMDIDIKYVDSIKKTPSGKKRAVINLLKSAQE